MLLVEYDDVVVRGIAAAVVLRRLLVATDAVPGFSRQPGTPRPLGLPELMALNDDIRCRAIFGNHLQGSRFGLAFRQSYTAGPRLCGAGSAL